MSCRGRIVKEFARPPGIGPAWSGERSGKFAFVDPALHFSHILRDSGDANPKSCGISASVQGAGLNAYSKGGSPGLFQPTPREVKELAEKAYAL
jgi:hypothetical protein